MRLSALFLAALLAVASPPARAQADASVPPETLAREAVETLLKALRAAIAGLPQYAAPEIDADGNITIRRLNPPPRAQRPTPPRDGGITL
jgi:hypothetical protein